MTPDCIISESIAILSTYFNRFVKIKSEHPVSGGDINEAVKISTSEGDYFIKWNNLQEFPKMFEYEASGLKLLKKTNTFYIPEIIGSSEINNYSFLLLEFINQKHRKLNFWQDFGLKLSQLHKNTSDFWGLDNNNYIGSLKQNNSKHQNWNQFFIEERIEPMIKLARDSNKIKREISYLFDLFFNKTDEIFPIEQPALLHGDLWSGNFITANDGYASLIDPAVYYGHREMDIAMTKLFGGFDPIFFHTYNEAFPMETGWQNRLDFYNLYPLMVHVNLFGGSYLNSVENILRRIT
jgi:protein-ribulosamine 3-kinase